MRAIARAVTTLALPLSFACGTYHPSRPPGSALELAAAFQPDAAGGMRSSTAVTATVFLAPPIEGAYIDGFLQSAEFTVYDGAFRVLAHRAVTVPQPFGRDGRLTVREVLDWEPADTLGHVLTVRFVIGRRYGASEEGPRVIERAITF